LSAIEEIKDENLKDESAETGSSVDEDAKNLEKIASLEADLGRAKDQYLRLAADFENYKKTQSREFSQSLKFANEPLLLTLLPLVDNLESALKAAKDLDSGPQKDLVFGINMVLKLWNEALEKFHIKSFSALGEMFDPARHEAVNEAVAGDDAITPGTVIDQYQKGYTLYERLLRPARVCVAKLKPETEEKKIG